MGHRVHYLWPCFCFVRAIIRLHFAPMLAVSELLCFQLQTQATRKDLYCLSCPLLCRCRFELFMGIFCWISEFKCFPHERFFVEELFWGFFHRGNSSISKKNDGFCGIQWYKQLRSKSVEYNAPFIKKINEFWELF